MVIFLTKGRVFQAYNEHARYFNPAGKRKTLHSNKQTKIRCSRDKFGHRYASYGISHGSWQRWCQRLIDLPCVGPLFLEHKANYVSYQRCFSLPSHGFKPPRGFVWAITMYRLHSAVSWRNWAKIKNGSLPNCYWTTILPPQDWSNKPKDVNKSTDGMPLQDPLQIN